MNSWLAFLILISILVFFHELGHFLVAKWCKVGVETFSIGFGPKIIKKKFGETLYCISALPLGGYVKMVGEQKKSSVAPGDIARSFTHKKLYQKSLIVAAGPLFNFLLSILIFFAIFQISGLFFYKPIIGQVSDNSPALRAGIKPGDVIKEINGVKIEFWNDIHVQVEKSGGSMLEILLERGKRKVATSLKPELMAYKNSFHEDKTRYIMGVTVSGEKTHISLNPFQAIYYSLQENWKITELTIVSVWKMIAGSVPSDELGGPIRIAQLAGREAEKGVTNFAYFIALISINLGIINLLPVPVLDGGHLMFFAVEAVTGREVSESVREKANQVGIFLLVLLMIFAFYNDIIQQINGG